MADTNIPGAIDSNTLIAELLQQAEAERQKTTGAGQKPQLPAGYSLDPVGSSFNPGLDQRVPLGFFTYVFDKNNNAVGYFKNGKFTSFEEDQKTKAATKAQTDANAAYSQAQTLQKQAANEFTKLTNAVKSYAAGKDITYGGGPLAGGLTSQQALQKYADDYQNTISKIKTAYEKSGKIQGNVQLDAQGNLLSPVTTGATAASAQPFTQPMTLAGVTPVTTPPAGGGGGAGGGGTGGGTGGKKTQDTTGFKLVKGVMQLGGSPFTGQAPNGKIYENGKETTYEQIRADFEKKFSNIANFVNSVPEFSQKGGLLDQAWQQGWTKDQWDNAVGQSQWIQSNPGQKGKSEIARLTQPGMYNVDYNNMYNRIKTLATNLGIDLGPDQLVALNPAAMSAITPLSGVDANGNLTNVVQWALQQEPSALTDPMIQQHLAKIGKLIQGAKGGSIFAQSQSLSGYARQMGMNPDMIAPGTNNMKWSDYNALQIAQGALDENAVKAKVLQNAKMLLPQYSQQLDEGQTVFDLASPYLNSLGSILELQPSELDIASPNGYGAMAMKALQGDGKSSQNIYDFNKSLYNDPRWEFTSNAKATMSNIGSSLLTAMGLKGL